MKRLILFCLVPFVIAACGGGGLPSYQTWVRPGAVLVKGRTTTLQDIEAKIALLECGAPSTSMTHDVYTAAFGISPDDTESYLKAVFLVEGCMERAGFKSLAGTLKESCDHFPHRRLTFPACQPDAVFPERSVERRLNSWHCKKRTDREYCRKHAFNPLTCDPPKDDDLELKADLERCRKGAADPSVCGYPGNGYLPPPPNRVHPVKEKSAHQENGSRTLFCPDGSCRCVLADSGLKPSALFHPAGVILRRAVRRSRRIQSCGRHFTQQSVI